MIDQLGQEYVVVAQVKGHSWRGAVWRHAFPNIMVPLITVVGLSYATLLEGAVLTETVFAWPGLGLYITQSLFNADMNAVLGGTIVIMMGMSNLAKNMERLVAGGMYAMMPVTVIEKGSTPEQRMVSSDITHIAEECRKLGVSSPAVIVVGKVASLCRTLGDLS